MSNQQESYSLVERKAEALVLLRHFEFDFQRASDILNIPEEQLRSWVENFDREWQEQIPAKRRSLKEKLRSKPTARKSNAKFKQSLAGGM